jgi:hypothetical protein
MRVWWRSAVKAFGVACLVYFAGVLAQTLHQDGCPVTDLTCASTSPTEGHLVLATIVVSVVAFALFAFRAIRKQRIWGPDRR